jgi:hypothetical protein
MVGRAAFSQEVLAELGWLTIVYGGLEELLVTFIAQLLSPEDQEPARDVAGRMGSQEKRETLKRLCSQRYSQATPELLAAMAGALRTCETAGAARNDLVHGLAEYNKALDLPFISRPGKPQRPITLEGVKAINALVFDAFRQTLNAFTPLWNSTKGHFE